MLFGYFSTNAEIRSGLASLRRLSCSTEKLPSSSKPRMKAVTSMKCSSLPEATCRISGRDAETPLLSSASACGRSHRTLF